MSTTTLYVGKHAGAFGLSTAIIKFSVVSVLTHQVSVPYIFRAQTCHYNDVIMGAIASEITSLTIVYSIVYSDADKRKHQSSASVAFVWGIHRGPVNSPHKWPVTQKMFPFDDVIMLITVSTDVAAQNGAKTATGTALAKEDIFSSKYLWALNIQNSFSLISRHSKSLTKSRGNLSTNRVTIYIRWSHFISQLSV